MIMRIYKRHYLGLPESEMKVRDGIVDGVVTVSVLLMIRAIYNILII